MRGLMVTPATLGAFDELPPGGVLVTPAGLGQHEGGLRELLDRDGAALSCACRAGVDDLEPRYGGADLETVVVDRQGHQARFETAGPYGVRELAGVLADDADRDLRMATGELLDELGEQEVVGGAGGPERRGSRGQSTGTSHDMRGVACGCESPLRLGSQQVSGLGQHQPAAGAHEERDAELGLEVGDLLGDARASQAQDVRRGCEGAVLLYANAARLQHEEAFAGRRTVGAVYMRPMSSPRAAEPLGACPGFGQLSGRCVVRGIDRTGRLGTAFD
jgi:hypothetical protein